MVEAFQFLSGMCSREMPGDSRVLIIPSFMRRLRLLTRSSMEAPQRVEGVAAETSIHDARMVMQVIVSSRER